LSERGLSLRGLSVRGLSVRGFSPRFSARDGSGRLLAAPEFLPLFGLSPDGRAGLALSLVCFWELYFSLIEQPHLSPSQASGGAGSMT
jgi:hypothetical protein